MAFLDNSGDIILDAVLTDTGRLRLSRGDGSFRISKFSLGDDEINYGEYNVNNLSGSAYYDLDILKTPVFEAFTNNTSNMNSKLISINRTNLLYLPVIKLSTELGGTQTFAGGTPAISDVFLVTADETTTKAFQDAGVPVGVMYGTAAGASSEQRIRMDQGLDNDSSQGPPASQPLDADLLETQYIVEMDNRFGSLWSGLPVGTKAAASFVDDDNIASYFLSRGLNQAFISNLDPNTANGANMSDSSLGGPRGTTLQVQIRSSINLSSATTLFTTLGSTMQITLGGTLVDFYTIDTTLRVTGATTGYRIDVPIRYIKKQ